MATATRLGLFALALVLVFGGAWGLGVLVGPIAPPPAPSMVVDHGGMAGMMGSDAGDDSMADIGTDGLAASAQGWTLTPVATTFPARAAADFGFFVRNDAGDAITAFAGIPGPTVTVVRRDGAGFLVLTPTRAPDGSWHAPLSLPAPGVYRAFVELGGPVLGVDLFAPGPFAPIAFPPSRTAEVDGLTVRLDGDLVPHQPSQVFATVSRAGAPVTDLQPFDGGFGRLVALRQGDLAFAEASPGNGGAAEPAPGAQAGPALAFTTLVHAPGTYRLFLQFRQGAAVHTAEFTVGTRVG
jgi:hypothetical protein